MMKEFSASAVLCGWCLLAMAGGLPAAEAADTDATQLGTINVIGVSPELGAELPEYLVPYNVQSASARRAAAGSA